VLDGELVAFNEQGAPYWPLLCERVLHGNRSIPVTFVALDVLRVDGHDVMRNPWSQRRALLEELCVERSCVRLSDVYYDGHVLFDASSSTGSRGSSRNAAPASTDLATARGRRSRTRGTGGGLPKGN
jgi:bifunctional non-homologous end joining protein LigD